MLISQSKPDQKIYYIMKLIKNNSTYFDIKTMQIKAVEHKL